MGFRRRLLAILPPGSVEAEVGKVQKALFADRGYLSAVALPPLVPVRFVSEGFGLRELAALARVASAPSFCTTEAAWVGGGLFLGIDSGGLWSRLSGPAGALDAGSPGAVSVGPDLPPPLFPVHEGFFLGCVEAPEEARLSISPAIVPPLRFSSCSLALLSIEAATETGQWWREVYLEMREKKPLRLKTGLGKV